MTATLEAIRALAEAATPGPWASQPQEDTMDAIVYGPDGDSFAHLAWNPGNDYDMVATAAYIAAVDPQTVLALLARLDRAEAALSVESVEAELHRVQCMNAKHRSRFTGQCRSAANIARGLQTRAYEEQP